MTYEERLAWLKKKHQELVEKKNVPIEGNGLYERYSLEVMSSIDMNKQAVRLFLLAFAMVFTFAACHGPEPEPVPPPNPAPTSITLSSSSFKVAQAGEELSLTITAPSRPQITGLPAWITYVDGTYSNYSIKVGLKVAANEDYEARTATLTVITLTAASGYQTETERVTVSYDEAISVTFDQPTYTLGRNITISPTTWQHSDILHSVCTTSFPRISCVWATSIWYMPRPLS